jgi:mannitol-1-phosphate 5-dehydrogenase
VTFSGSRRLVSLGFGAIGAGLFVYEAHRAGDYAPPLVVDVRADLLAALRAAGGHFRINIARSDRVDVAEVGPAVVADSTVAREADLIVEAIAGADEFASALPSVAFYQTDDASSPHRLLAAGLRRRTRTEPLIIFCAENQRSAAALLEAAVLEAVPVGERDAVRGRARYVDTVIGKMSGVITDESELRAGGFATITSGLPAAFLVEAFDRILVSRVGAGLHPGMPVLREVDDLAPFEDAKLLGHNATHALAGFLGSLLGLTLVADLRHIEGAMDFLRTAFVEESGATLCRRWEGADDLFTEHGFEAFADDLLERMVNPHLADTIERAARDPRRKLGWDDRLVGLVRLGLAEDVPTPRYAMGVAAGLDVLRASDTDHGYDADLLRAGWPDGLDPEEVGLVIDAVAEGRERLERWRHEGFAAASA